jgi:ribosomal protein L37AE/L43A
MTVFIKKITKVMAKVVRKRNCLVCHGPLRRVSREEYYCKFCGLEYVLERGPLLVKGAKYT